LTIDFIKAIPEDKILAGGVKENFQKGSAFKLILFSLIIFSHLKQEKLNQLVVLQKFG